MEKYSRYMKDVEPYTLASRSLQQGLCPCCAQKLLPIKSNSGEKSYICKKGESVYTFLLFVRSWTSTPAEGTTTELSYILEEAANGERTTRTG